MFVQFKDASATEIVSSFGCEQDPEVFQNLGVVEADDPRYLAFVETLPKTPLLDFGRDICAIVGISTRLLPSAAER